VERLADAVDYAYALGLLKFVSPGKLSHAPFTLQPAPIPADAHARSGPLTSISSLLAFRIGTDPDFLSHALEEVARVDEFTAWLLALSQEVPPGSTQPLELLISRNDFFLQQSTGDALVDLRQVEFNAIAASYPGLSGLTHDLHAALWLERSKRLVANDPLTGLCDGLAAAVARHGTPGADVIMVVQADETNIFDQRLIELRLAQRGIPLRRLTLEHIAAHGQLREGHLLVNGKACAVAYFRAGYAPADLATDRARRGRSLLEHSDAVVVPRIGVHLAGTKKVQQILTDGRILERYLDKSSAQRLSATFAGLWEPEALIATPQGEIPAWRAAMAAPDRFVLKPQREGGGNNFYDEDISRVLKDSTHRERAGYILMERIHPMPHDAVLVREGKPTQTTCVSEIGRFGVLLAEQGRVLINHDIGYLVRTRDHQLREGGVSAGFGHLSSLEIVS
jgi:glutathione synthetase